MTVEGVATLSNASASGQALEEGDLLAVDDLIEVGPSSYVDLAYDRDWSNVTRVEENSSIRIRSLYPTVVGLEGGGVFAKLKSLPKESSFDVQTPTAIASVRGSEYRTTYLNGQTEVENAADSDVFVYGFDDAGQKQPEPVVVRHSEKTQILQRGQRPVPPRPMQPHELARAGQFREKIEQKVRQNVERGRYGRMHEAGVAERFREQRQKRAEGRRPGPDGALRSDGDRPRPESERSNFVSGQGLPERRPRAEESRPSGGLAEPFFPSGERQRSGGPQAPSGLPDERWKSGSENDPRREPGSHAGPDVKGPQNHNQAQNKGQKAQQPGKPAGKPRSRP